MTEVVKESIVVLKRLRDAYLIHETDSEIKDNARLIVVAALDVAISELEAHNGE